jgi:origin recognition complex subunit 5
MTARSGSAAEDRSGKLLPEKYTGHPSKSLHCFSDDLQIKRQLLGPQTFSIERLLAIFPVIVPESIPSSVDIQAQIATLTSLRLLVKATPKDPLDVNAKWKVNVGREYIRAIACSIRFELEDYMTE